MTKPTTAVARFKRTPLPEHLALRQTWPSPALGGHANNGSYTLHISLNIAPVRS